MNSIIGFEQAGEAHQPSPSIWKDCPGPELNEFGTGFYADVQFLGLPVIAAVLPPNNPHPALQVDADTDTVFAAINTVRGGALSIETDADDNDAASVFTAPFGRIVRNSGQKLWFEAIVAAGDVDADMGIFVGLAELAGLSRDVLSDNVGSNGVITESLVGFLQDNGDDNALDLVYRKDAGTLVNSLDDVTNAAAITAQGGTVASLTDGAFFKLGLKFDGRDKLHAFVNGYEVKVIDVDSTFDQAKDLGAIVAIKTGTTAAEQVHVKRLRVGFQER